VDQAGDFSEHNLDTICCESRSLDRVAQRRRTPRAFLRGFGVSARGLTREQSAMLAAVLPNPKGWDPAKPSGRLRWRQRRILQRERNANFPEKMVR
jgi:hypothetical protein